jgi:hypothetical protein
MHRSSMMRAVKFLTRIARVGQARMQATHPMHFFSSTLMECRG